MDIKDRVISWLLSGDTGASSEAICAHMTGNNTSYRHSYPSDPSDLGRCLMLLESIPEWKPRIMEMAKYSPARAGLYTELLAKEFATELAKSGLSDEQIIAGSENFKRSATDNPWMPNPGEFVEMCREANHLGLPGMREAYKEACKNASELMDANWTHPAVYVAGKAAGWFDLRNKTEKETWPIFKQAYKDALARVAAGENLEVFVPVAQIEQRDVFKADLDTPGRVKALSMIRRLKND